MPSFAEVPFEMSRMEAQLPPDTSPTMARAVRAMYESLVASADDIWVIAEMHDPDDAVELTEDEIDIYRTGAVAGLTVMIECFMKHQILDPDKFGAYLTSLVRQ